MVRKKMQFIPLFERTAEAGEMGRRGGGSERVALDLREPALWLKRNPPDQKVGGPGHALCPHAGKVLLNFSVQICH